MRDKYSGEVARTLWQYGFYKKNEDAGYRNRATKEMAKQADPGLADGYFFGITGGPLRAFVETKTGGDRFAFDSWTEKQRLFMVACEYSRIPYWLFLFMGDRIGGKRHPRVAFLVRGEDMVDTIYAAGDRKSLSYDTALTRFQPLEWQGSGIWNIPLGHPFHDRDQRNTATGPDSQGRQPETWSHQELKADIWGSIGEDGHWRYGVGSGPAAGTRNRQDFAFFKTGLPNDTLPPQRDGDDTGLSGFGLRESG